MILDGLIGNRLSMLEHIEIMGGTLAFAMPKKLEDMDVLVNHMILICDLTFLWVEMLGKMFKVYKRTVVDFELKDKEAKDLKEVVE